MLIKLILLSICICVCSSQTILTSPPLGWNTWDAYTGNISEALFLSELDWFAQNLKPYGWQYLVIDGGWDEGADTKTDGYSRTIPKLKEWPSSADGVGLKKVGEKVHKLGLLFGLHLMRGINAAALTNNDKIAGTDYHAKDVVVPKDRCVWDESWLGVNMSHPGGAAFYNSLMEQMYEWGVDFVKVDCIGFGRDQHNADILAITNAIELIKKKYNHRIVYSLSPGANAVPSDVGSINVHVDMYRVTDDLWDCWNNETKSPNCRDGMNIYDDFERFASWQPFIAQPGLNGPSFPDGDMLPVGVLYPNTPSYLTHEEEKILITLWTIFRNPLMIGSQLRNMPASTLQLLTNTEVIDINQKSTGNRVVFIDKAKQVHVWRAEIGEAYYVALFNIGSNSVQQTTFTFRQAGVSPAKTTCKLYDVWSKAELGSHTISYTAKLFPTTAMLLRLSDCN